MLYSGGLCRSTVDPDREIAENSGQDQLAAAEIDPQDDRNLDSNPSFCNELCHFGGALLVGEAGHSSRRAMRFPQALLPDRSEASFEADENCPNSCRCNRLTLSRRFDSVHLWLPN
jgi:hypothetical protein